MKFFKNMATWKKIILSFTLLAILFIGGSFIYLNYLLNKPTKVTINKNNLSVNKEISKNLDTKKEIKNIALFGIDAPEGKNGRSDSIMILTIDKKNNELKLSSIMRDSYLDIKGYGKDKVTHAYAFGGPELAINTLNRNLNLNIENFITVNFTTLPTIIDKLNGIELNITKGDLKYLESSITKTGLQNLNGDEALAYSRIRYDGGDQMRTQRQRNVIDAIFKKVIAIPVSNYPSILNELLPFVKTNLSSSEFMSIGKDIAFMKISKIKQYRLPCNTHSKGKNINGVYYMTFDTNIEKKELHDFIYNKNSK